MNKLVIRFFLLLMLIDDNFDQSIDSASFSDPRISDGNEAIALKTN